MIPNNSYFEGSIKKNMEFSIIGLTDWLKILENIDYFMEYSIILSQGFF